MDHDNNKASFEKAADLLKGDIFLAGRFAAQDATARQTFEIAVEQLIEEMRRDVRFKELTWREATEHAGEARDDLFDMMRGRSSPMGRAIAESMGAQGVTINELIGRYALKQFGGSTRFALLTGIQKNEVYAEIVAAARRANPGIAARVLRWSFAGRRLLFLSFAIAVYEIFAADDRADALGVVMAGSNGGMVAGIPCGPGFPPCVALGAFLGGALAGARVGA